MAITSKSSLKDVLESKEACDIIEQYFPGFMERSAEFGPVMGMKIGSLLKFPQVGLDRATVKELCAKLDELGE